MVTRKNWVTNCWKLFKQYIEWRSYWKKQSESVQLLILQRM